MHSNMRMTVESESRAMFVKYIAIHPHVWCTNHFALVHAWQVTNAGLYFVHNGAEQAAHIKQICTALAQL